MMHKSHFKFEFILFQLNLSIIDDLDLIKQG